MNCAEKYDYIAEELLVCHIYTLGGQVIYNNLLLAGWRDFQEITKPLNVTEITKLVAKKKRREDAIFESLVAFKRAGANAIVSYYADKIEKIIK